MIDKNKIIIRKAVRTDDVKQIAKLIYSSDLNIYGAMFGDVNCAARILQELISTETINISIKNLIVAEYEKAVVGMLCFIEEDYMNDREAYKQAFSKLAIEVPKYFDGVFDVYWQKVIREDFTNAYYISNVAVDEAYQNLGIGKMLLNYFKETHKDKPIGLDVVKDNAQAINAYLKSGFEIVEKEHNNTDLPAPVRMVCHQSLKV
ncbi:GNAT family N-acetyltransferase [Niameybacter massiliensis]|uniref:GNAT family N-acetyltransferase n=1 Tax=Niameybacter massiliensis TaxID=1658108 RepID=UPI0006B418BD|nr:GNAT family N-acetyltransferase [Niameybacter massiliensis]